MTIYERISSRLEQLDPATRSKVEAFLDMASCAALQGLLTTSKAVPYTMSQEIDWRFQRAANALEEAWLLTQWRFGL